MTLRRLHFLFASTMAAAVMARCGRREASLKTTRSQFIEAQLHGGLGVGQSSHSVVAA